MSIVIALTTLYICFRSKTTFIYGGKTMKKDYGNKQIYFVGGMPYIISMFQPRAMKDRPRVVPENSTNLAMISQFVEIPEDMVFTEEYSIRAARIAVYTLLGLDKKLCPVTPHKRDVRTLLKALSTSFR